MLIQADAFNIPLADKLVHCCVTSPPYWGLRKYAGDQGDEPLGLEPTPERHIERTVQWAREIYRVLRDDGVFWLNYGDTYDSSGGTHGGGKHAYPREPNTNRSNGVGNLLLMPHRVALALQQDGWIVRQDLVWSKPNPMPESVNGWRYQLDETEAQALQFKRGSWRHTRAHEYVFMLTKQMQYWSDQEAVREAAEYGRRVQPADTWDRTGQDARHVGGATSGADPSSGRNPRSVLHIPTAPYRGAHYATFPPALIAPLILATCPRWCCPVCGQGWAPVVEHINPNKMPVGGKLKEHLEMGTRNDGNMRMGDPVSNVLGHRPTCDHPHTQAEAVPGICLDPFVGSGTTVMVAKQLLKRGIGLDISRPYLDEQAKLRTGEGSPKDSLSGLPMLELLDGHLEDRAS